MGLRNISLCHLTVELPKSLINFPALDSADYPLPQVKRWSVFELNGWDTPKAFEQPHFASMAIQLVDKLLGSMGMDIVLIEQQRMRSGGSRSVPEIIAQINVLEGMLHAILANKRNSYVESVSPAKVTSYWIDEQTKSLDSKPSRKLTPSQRYAKTKKAKVAVVESWINKISTTPVQFSPGVLEEFRAQTEKLKKRDDLCDSLLQAIAWIHWQTNRISLQHQLESNTFTNSNLLNLLNR